MELVTVRRGQCEVGVITQDGHVYAAFGSSVSERNVTAYTRHRDGCLSLTRWHGCTMLACRSEVVREHHDGSLALTPRSRRKQQPVANWRDNMSQNGIKKPLFSLGRIVATPGALEALQAAGQSPGEFLARHVTGDWGDLDAEDRSLNNGAVRDGSRILSAYVTRKGERLWVITEAADEQGHRFSSTLLRPEDY
jgi:hypothetical protein